MDKDEQQRLCAAVEESRALREQARRHCMDMRVHANELSHSDLSARVVALDFLRQREHEIDKLRDINARHQDEGSV